MVPHTLAKLRGAVMTGVGRGVIAVVTDADGVGDGAVGGVAVQTTTRAPRSEISVSDLTPT